MNNVYVDLIKAPEYVFVIPHPPPSPGMLIYDDIVNNNIYLLKPLE